MRWFVWSFSAGWPVWCVMVDVPEIVLVGAPMLALFSIVALFCEE